MNGFDIAIKIWPVFVGFVVIIATLAIALYRLREVEKKQKEDETDVKKERRQLLTVSAHESLCKIATLEMKDVLQKELQEFENRFFERLKKHAVY